MVKRPVRLHILRALLFVMVCEAAGIVGSFFTFPAIGTWYNLLAKPWFTPPSYLFGPVWTLLYALMGVSAYLAWELSKGTARSRAMSAFFVQLSLNILWSAVFFGLKSPLYGLAVIILLAIGIAVTILQFAKVSRTSAALMAPYLAWVLFAAILNFYIAIMN